MPDRNIIDLPEATVLNSADKIHISQGEVDKRIDASVFLAQLEGGNPWDVEPRDISGTTYTALLGDKDAFFQCLNGSGTAFTLPNHANAPFNIGDQFTVKNDSSGVVTFLLDTGVTVRESTVGLTLDTRGQAATFINVGENVWNMISGGSSDAVSPVRSKSVRSSDVGRTDTGSPTLVVDSQLNVVGLEGASTYKVTATLKVSTTSATASMQYYVGPPTYAAMASGDFITHVASLSDSTFPVQIGSSGDSPNNTLLSGSSGTSYVTITGEVTVPSGENSIGLYWDSVAGTETVTLLTGSCIVVEGV